MEGKKVLILGGAGFLGSNLARRLIENNKVSIFVKDETNLSRIEEIKNHENIEIIGGDLLDKEKVREVVREKDYLYYFAWQTDLKKSMANPDKDLRSDLGGLINVLEVCREVNKGIKIIFASTVTVIGEASKIPSNEDEKEKPTSIYDANKLMAEKYLQVYYKNHGVKICILRLSNVFGEYQRIDNPSRGVLNFMIGRALRGEVLTVYGEGDFIRDYSYVQDYIEAFVLAAESENTDGELYVLGSGIGRTFKEVVEGVKKVVEDMAAREVRIEHVDFPQGNKIEKRDFITDSSKFKEDTGWKPNFSFEEGLRRTVGFYYNKN